MSMQNWGTDYHSVDALCQSVAMERQIHAALTHLSSGGLMTASGQKHVLPHRNIGIRFTPVSRHYASEAIRVHVIASPCSAGWVHCAVPSY